MRLSPPVFGWMSWNAQRTARAFARPVASRQPKTARVLSGKAGRAQASQAIAGAGVRRPDLWVMPRPWFHDTCPAVVFPPTRRYLGGTGWKKAPARRHHCDTDLAGVAGCHGNDSLRGPGWVQGGRRPNRAGPVPSQGCQRLPRRRTQAARYLAPPACPQTPPGAHLCVFAGCLCKRGGFHEGRDPAMVPPEFPGRVPPCPSCLPPPVWGMSI